MIPLHDARSYPRQWARRIVARLSPWQRRALWVIAVGIMYFVVETVASRFTMPDTFIAVVWPASGVAVAIGILVGPWVALGVFAADAFYSTKGLDDPAVGLAVAAGNALQVFVIAWTIRRFAGGRFALQTPLGVVRYSLMAGLVGTVTSASVGVSALTLAGHLPPDAFATNWLVWYATDVVSMLLITPFIVVWIGERRVASAASERVAFLAVLALVAAGIALVPREAPRYAFAVLSLPLITWAAFRLGGRLVVLTTLVLGAAAATALAWEIDGDAIAYFLEVQAFVAAAAATGLVVAAAVRRERERFKTAAEREALAASEARDKLLSSFAHELNNPLTPILLNIDLLKDERVDAARRRQSLLIIERNAVRLSRLIADLKDVGTIQSRRAFRLRPAATSLSVVATGAVDSYRVAAANAGLRLEIDAPADIEARVDADRITQVLSNLLANAIKYAPSGGIIRVRLTRSTDRAIIMVEDEGIGMTRSQIHQLFEPFAQVQDAGSQKEGTGLGLYIARGIAEAHGGTLSCASEGPGRGSRFTLELPLGPLDDSPPLANTPASTQGASA